MDPVETVIEMINSLALSEAEDMDWEHANQGTKRKAEDEHPEQPPAKRQR